jgi:hypothetical protein
MLLMMDVKQGGSILSLKETFTMITIKPGNLLSKTKLLNFVATIDLRNLKPIFPARGAWDCRSCVLTLSTSTVQQRQNNSFQTNT